MSSMNDREYKETSHDNSEDWNDKVSEFLKGVSKGNECKSQCSSKSGFNILVRNANHSNPHKIQEKSWTSLEENHPPHHVSGDYSDKHLRNQYSEKIMNDRLLNQRSSRNRTPNHPRANFSSEYGRHFHNDELHSEEFSKRGMIKDISHEGKGFRKRDNVKEGWQSRRSPSNRQINISRNDDRAYWRHSSPSMEQFIQTNEDTSTHRSNIKHRRRDRQEVTASNSRSDRKHYSIRSLSDEGSDTDSFSHSRKDSVSMSSDCEKLFNEVLLLKHKQNEIKVQNRLNQERDSSHNHSPYFKRNERSNSLDSTLAETEYHPRESQFRYYTLNQVNSRYEEPQYPLFEDELALLRDSSPDNLSDLECQDFSWYRNQRLSHEFDSEDRDPCVGKRIMNSRRSRSPCYSGYLEEPFNSDYDCPEPIARGEGSPISYHRNRNDESNLRDSLDGSPIHNIEDSPAIDGSEIVNCSRSNELFEEEYDSQRVIRQNDTCIMRVTLRRSNSSEREFFERTSSRRNRMRDGRHPTFHNSNRERLVHKIPEKSHHARREISCGARSLSPLDKNTFRLKTRTALNTRQKSRSPARTRSRDFNRNCTECGSFSCDGLCQATISERRERLKSPQLIRVRRSHDVSEIQNSNKVCTDRGESTKIGNKKSVSCNRSSYNEDKRDEDDCNNSMKRKVSERSPIRHDRSGSPNSTGKSKGRARGSLVEVSCSKRQKTTKKSKCENPGATFEEEPASFFSLADWTTVDSWSIDENSDDLKNDRQNKSGDKQVKTSEKSIQNHSTYDTKYGQSSRPEPESRINIQGLSPSVTEVDLKNVLWQSRVVFKDIRVARDVFTGKSLCYALIKFFTVSDAVNFMERKKGVLKLLNSQGVMKYMSKTTYNRLTDRIMMDWVCVCGTYNEKKLHKCIRCKGYRTNGKVVPLENQINKNVILLTGLNSLVTVKKVQTSLPVLSSLPAGCLRSVRIYSKIGSDTATCAIEMDSPTNAKLLFTILKNDPPRISGTLVSVEYKQHLSGKRVIKTLTELSNLDKQWRQRKSSHQLPGNSPKRRIGKQLGTTTANVSTELLNTNDSKDILNPALQENESLDEPPDGSGSLKYPFPKFSSLQYDSSSGYYYDPYTHLYYDVNSQYFYNNQLKKFLYWDSSSSSYLLAPSQEVKEAQSDSIEDEKYVFDKIKIGLASNSNKMDEKLAKMLSDQKLKAKKKLAAAQNLMKSAASEENISTTQEGDSTTADEIKNPCIDTSDTRTEKKVDNVNPSTNEEISTDSESHLDLVSMICLLCKRHFPNEKLLTKHAKESVLHKQNLDMLKGNNLEEML